MPFLRFTRDKRGYETTSLVHAGRQRGRTRQRILYWFRTPPGVKVGRPALDEEAIRWIEEHNTDIEFDWPKILQAQPPPAAPVDDGRTRRVRRDARDKSERGGKEGRRRQSDPPPPVTPPEAESALSEPDLAMLPPPSFEDESPLVESEPEATVVEPAVELAVAKEQLTRLRARYAELQARITERGGDATRIEELRRQAEVLNPDTWVTAEEVRKGLEEFEPKIRDLRAALGLRRRRRSRRGGRRHHKPGEAVAADAPQAVESPEASNTDDDAEESG